MNILHPTVEDIKKEIRLMFAGGENMVDEIISDGILRENYLKCIKGQLTDKIKWTKGKQMKEYAKDCKTVIMHYLETGEVKGIYEINTPKETKKPEIISKKNIENVMNALSELGILNDITGTPEWSTTITDAYKIINK